MAIARRSAPRALRAIRTTTQPKTTRPPGASRRTPAVPRTVEKQIQQRLDALPDRIDIRDWLYRPALDPLPDTIVNCDRVPGILNQGQEGACTGFALAAVIQYHRAARGLKRFEVSPRMLYEMARRFDEWPGETYDGSSARGAMKGWMAHGVCSRRSWPDSLHGPQHLTERRAEEGRRVPGGAYYRVVHRNVRDMHAALADIGIVYVTLMVHAGWAEPGAKTRRVSNKWRLPVIERRGKADAGHAVAFVGYTSEGFVVQNSWGDDWGEGGFALLPYEDYLIHATDVWVAQVGVPVTVDLWASGAADTTAGVQRAATTIPLSEVRPYIVDVGNNGLWSDSGDYWTTEDDLRRLFSDTIPAAAENWKTKRIMLYLHGGLNDEAGVAKRVVAYRDVFLANQIYPLHIMWESGAKETIRSILQDFLSDADERAGDWMSRFRDHLVEAKDRTFELTVSRAGTSLWAEMKENARLASERSDQRGGLQLIVQHARQALAKLTAAQRRDWELHVVAHSAGSIFAAHALQHLLTLGVNFKSISFMAPAITIADFTRLMMPAIRNGLCPLPTLFLLSDQGELDDDVGPYGKSLLFLVSNAFEGVRGLPLLGMQRFLVQVTNGPTPNADVARLFHVDDTTAPKAVVIAGTGDDVPNGSQSDSHGGFDNDVLTMNSILQRILGAPPAKPFVTRDLQF